MKPLKGYLGASFDLLLGFKPDHGAQSELNRKHFPEKNDPHHSDDPA
jgi:hypothetical protein